MSKTLVADLRQRLADYQRLRAVTWDAQALGAIDAIIAETEDRLRRVAPPDRPQTDRPDGDPPAALAR